MRNAEPIYKSLLKFSRSPSMAAQPLRPQKLGDIVGTQAIGEHEFKRFETRVYALLRNGLETITP